MTIVALRFRDSSSRRVLREYLPEILPGKAPSCRANLSLLGGFAFGVLSTECSSDQEWVGQLLVHMGQYLDIVTRMGLEDCHQLSEYLVTVFAPLTEVPSD